MAIYGGVPTTCMCTRVTHFPDFESLWVGWFFQVGDERDRLRRWGAELFLSFNVQRNRCRCDFLQDLFPVVISCFQLLAKKKENLTKHLFDEGEFNSFGASRNMFQILSAT